MNARQAAKAWIGADKHGWHYGAEYEHRVASLTAAFDAYARSRLGPLVTFDKLGADRLADEVAVLIDRRVIDSRSPAGDALLDYRNPPRTPRSDALVDLRAKLSALLAAIEPLLAAEEKATPGPWTRERHPTPKARREIDASGSVLVEIVTPAWPDQVAVAGTPGRQVVYAPNNGSYPSADCDFIVTAKNACAGLRAAVESLKP